MRILLAYPGHAFSTFDVARGYQTGLKAAGHIVQSFDYHTRLTFYDRALDAWEATNPDFTKDLQQVKILASEAILAEVVDFAPDVVLVVNGTALHPRAYELMWRLGVPYAMLLTESPYADDLQMKMIQAVQPAAVFTNERNSVPPIRQNSTAAVAYLPHAYNPAQHRVTAVSGEYSSDVFFFGTLWPERERLFTSLLERDNGRYRIGGLGISGRDAALQSLSNDELVRWYNGTAVAVNHHRTFSGANDGSEHHIDTGAAWSLGPRAFEIAACGAFQLCDDTRGELTAVFGDAVPTYHDSDTLAAQVDYYLTHPQARQEMAKAAHQRVQPHTFENRVLQVINPTLEAI